MSDTVDQEHFVEEEKILLSVKRAITMVIKDTATEPGLMHPLSDDTILYIRSCLGIITQREQDLAKLTGRDLNKKPRYADEPKPQNNIVVGFEPKIPQKP